MSTALPPMDIHLVDASGRVLGPVTCGVDGVHAASHGGKTWRAEGLEPLAVAVAPLCVRLSMGSVLVARDGSTSPCRLDITVGHSAGAEFQVRYRVEVHGQRGTVQSPWRDDWLDVALDDVRALLRPVGMPRHCFACRWSDYPPRSGAGSLHCFVEHPDAYLRAAMSRNADVRRAGAFLSCTPMPVSELHHCSRFDARPQGLGARG